jgi:hypothetical protein
LGRVLVGVELAVLGAELVGERLEELLAEEGGTEAEHVEESAPVRRDISAAFIVPRRRRWRVARGMARPVVD